MTYGFTENGQRGLIEITEADEFAQQEILYTIPVEESIARDIESKKEFFEFIGETPIEAKIITDRRPLKIDIKAKKLKQLFIAEIQDQILYFKIDEKLNFKQTFGSLVRPKIKKRNLFNLIRAAILILGLIIKDIFSSILLEGMLKTYTDVLPKDGIKNIYIGSESEEEYENYRFLILTLVNNTTMENLYLKNKTFFVN